jgi:8-oxo-dGTP diphosphatase
MCCQGVFGGAGRPVMGHSGEGEHSVRVSGEASQRIVTAILRRGNRILLCHRCRDREWFPNVWSLPGGHVEAGESEEAALVRELQEELGFEVAGPLGRPFRRITDPSTDVEMIVWVVDYDGPVVNRAPHEHDEIRWASSSETASLNLAHPDYTEMFAEVLRPETA